MIGFVFVEANVKKWGLAPVQGTLAPPPAYGYEAGSLLLERGRIGETSHLLGAEQQENHNHCDIPSIVGSNSIINDEDEDVDDNTPLIQHVRGTNNNNYASIPIPSRRREGAPTYSPPSYSTFPRLSLLMGRGNSSDQEEFERNRRAHLV